MKKTVRLLSVLVVIAVICSALFALTACGPNEFTVTYHDLHGNKMGTEVVARGGNATGQVAGYKSYKSIKSPCFGVGTQRAAFLFHKQKVKQGI